MDGQAGPCVQLLVADVALEVLCLLVLDQDLLVVELPVAVPGTVVKDRSALANRSVFGLRQTNRPASLCECGEEMPNMAR